MPSFVFSMTSNTDTQQWQHATGVAHSQSWAPALPAGSCWVLLACLACLCLVRPFCACVLLFVIVLSSVSLPLWGVSLAHAYTLLWCRRHQCVQPAWCRRWWSTSSSSTCSKRLLAHLLPVRPHQPHDILRQSRQGLPAFVGVSCLPAASARLH